MKVLKTLLLTAVLFAGVADARMPPTLGDFIAQVPTTWVENLPAQGAQCSLYINGILSVSRDADASGQCVFGYVHAVGTYSVRAYKTLNGQDTGVTATGQTTLSVPNNGKVVLQLR